MSFKKLERRIKKPKTTTHLFLNNKRIKDMNKLTITDGLKVIYLQNNCIKSIENLNSVTNLTHLYLQHNEITKIENLQNLRNLVKLYLGYNKISVIEGLDNLEHLLELHVECQKFESGESLYLEPRTTTSLSRSLEYLNISGNNIFLLKDVYGFQNLKTLIAKDNSIKDMEDVATTINNLPNLLELCLQNNPVTHLYRYRENVIANSYQLKILDGKFITDVSRDFMQNFKREMQLHFVSKRSQTSLSDDITSSLNLPLSFRLSISRAIRDQPETNLSVSFKSSSMELHPRQSTHWKSSPSMKTVKEVNLFSKNIEENEKQLE